MVPRDFEKHFPQVLSPDVRQTARPFALLPYPANPVGGFGWQVCHSCSRRPSNIPTFSQASKRKVCHNISLPMFWLKHLVKLICSAGHQGLRSYWGTICWTPWPPHTFSSSPGSFRDLGRGAYWAVRKWLIAMGKIFSKEGLVNNK